MEEFRVLELFSGIGGMHYALKYSGCPGKVITAVDINPIANSVYKHNYRNTTVLNNNIQKLTPKSISKMNVNTILMSPPCQPFTRVGLKKDIADARTDALRYICKIIPELHTVESILMENVKGFENSKARDIFAEALQNAGFYFREFILSPSQFGVPNTRYRYYCLARRQKDFEFKKNVIVEKFPLEINSNKPQTVQDVIGQELTVTDDAILPDDLLLKRAWLLDIATPASSNTICFTKAYTHYSEGTGSVFTNCSKEQVSEVFKICKALKPDSEEYLEILRTLRLRYFTPTEVAKLMSFPKSFHFPDHITNRQRYRLLGNSINVLVVGELIKLLSS